MAGPMEHPYPALQPFSSHERFQTLTDEEIDNFYKEIDTNNDGHVSFEELEQRLEKVYTELVPEPRKHHLHHPERRRPTTNDIEKQDSAHPEHDGIHAFLCSLMPNCASSITEKDFKDRVRSWNIPSQNQNSAEDEDKAAHDYQKKLTTVRKVRAYWAIRGPKILFLAFVFALILAFGLWQCLKYAYDPVARSALGWGVIVAKLSAGVLYPSLFFMILSMSRWFATACRRFYYLSRFVNWDRHQSFHIWMACISLGFATLHAIGHLTGTFLYGSRLAQQDNLAQLLGPDQVPKPYISFIRSLPGWTGLTSISLFWTIAILSEPHVKKWSYEIFQIGHLLMFPLIGFLCAHGTARLLQYPMLGYWLAFPTLLVICERLHRLYRGFVRIPTKVEVLDDDTVALSCYKPGGKPWRYTAGQYVFLQVPSLSFFQWHPFTISACRDDVLQLHIKTDGDWTNKLRDLSSESEIQVGIDGPFGAPAQRFYEYDRALIIGAGVGVTPFSAILTDLETNLSERKDPWSNRRSSVSVSVANAWSRRGSSVRSTDEEDKEKGSTHAEAQSTTRNPQNTKSRRRVDFHWIVRDKNYLLWFSSLLNRAHDLAEEHKNDQSQALDLNLVAHVTMKRKNIGQHVFRYLLDAYRSSTQPVSALTGLKLRSAFGRPDFEDILTKFYDDIVRETQQSGTKSLQRIGVFYCGPPVIGEVLSDVCEQLTQRAKAEKTRMRWDFRIEVFG